MSLGRRAAMVALQAPSARVDDYGCPRCVELGLDRRRFPPGKRAAFLGLGSLGRHVVSRKRSALSRAVSKERRSWIAKTSSQEEARAARSLFRCVVRCKAVGVSERGKRVLASAGQHVRGAKGLEGVSTFRIVLQKSFDDADAQRSCARVFIRVVNGG